MLDEATPHPGNTEVTATPSAASTTSRRCDVCDVDIDLRHGGEFNWNRHIESKAHKRNARMPPKKPNKSIMSFFPKFTPKRKEAVAPLTTSGSEATGSSTNIESVVSAPCSPAAETPGSAPTANVSMPDITLEKHAEPMSEDDEIILVKHIPPAVPQPSSLVPIIAQPHPILARLQRAAETLPLGVPAGCADDVLAQFKHLPQKPSDGSDPWEVVDPILNNLIGYGASKLQIAQLVRRGKYGMTSFCTWINACVIDLGIDIRLLEEKLERLIDAMKFLGASDTPDTSATASTPAPSSTVVATTESQAVRKHRRIPCPGYLFPTCAPQHPYMSYPVALHARLSLPWSIHFQDNTIILRAFKCKNEAIMNETMLNSALPCEPCSSIINNPTLTGILRRNKEGAHKNTPLDWLTVSQLQDVIQYKTDQNTDLRLDVLNQAQQLLVRTTTIDLFKRFTIALGRKNIPRLSQLIRSAQKQGLGIHGIIDRVNMAAEGVYKPKGYDEADYQRGFLFSALGGRPLSQLANRVLGVPSIDTAKRHLQFLPLRTSPKMPTNLEVLHNLQACFPMPDTRRDEEHLLRAILRATSGYILSIDDIKITPRLRWDPPTNTMVGACRDHVGSIALEFASMDQADALKDALDKGEVHLASEATVVAFGSLSGRGHDYIARPIAVSGTCKREDVSSQKLLIERCATAAREYAKMNGGGRLYCFETDGDARRRQALALLTMVQTLAPDSPLRLKIGELTFFDYTCGLLEETVDYDYRHTLKRFRNTLLRATGVTIDGININTALLERHMIADGINHSHVNAILSPNDKQDVTLMFKLLSAIANLRSGSDTDAPNFRSTRRVTTLLGTLYTHLLEPYTNVNLTLHEQLTHLAAAAHLILALYSTHKGTFIPAQLYHDTMCMIKNAFFCVAKTQIDNPDGLFWLILLCSDELEKLFGRVRSMLGTDSNCDQLQLTHRLDSSVQCNTILAAHPDWADGPRRLAFKSVLEQGHETSQKADHINPTSWVGNLEVKRVVLSSCWLQGRRLAENALSLACVDSPFAVMERSNTIDILRPFGDGKIVLIDGALKDGECEEIDIDIDTDIPQNVSVPGAQLAQVEPHAGAEPDIEDLAGVEVASSENPSVARSAWVPLSGNSESDEHKHKASVMRLYSDLLVSGPESRDRLKRVMGYSRHMHRPGVGISTTHYLTGDDDPVLNVEDPGLSLFLCNDRIYVAAVSVAALTQDSRSVSSIPIELIHEPNVRIKVQIMCLRLLLPDGNPEDWEWTGRAAPIKAMQYTCDIEGKCFQAYNAVVTSTQTPGNPLEATYRFTTSEMVAAGAFLYGRLHTDLDRLPKVTESGSFPYTTSSGAVCFLCEDEGSPRGGARTQRRCMRCPTLALSLKSGAKLVEHISTHILFDQGIDADSEPCGFCLNSGICTIYLAKGKGRKGGPKIDEKRTRCVNKVNMQITHAARETAKSPCTNRPLMCPLCPAGAPAVWKYNLKSHLLRIHKTPNIAHYESLYSISHEERTRMKEKYLTKPRSTKKKRRQELQERSIAVSDAHAIRYAFRSGSSSSTSAGRGAAKDDSRSSNLRAEASARRVGSQADANDLENGEFSDRETSDSDEEPEFSDGSGVTVRSKSMNSRSSDDSDRELSEEEHEHDPPNVRGTDTFSEGDEPSSTQKRLQVASPPRTHSSVSPPRLEDTLASIPANVDPSSTSNLERTGLRRSRRAVAQLSALLADQTCSDEHCDTPNTTEGMIQCVGPGCAAWYHLGCRGLLEMPASDWACDESCARNAGLRRSAKRARVR